MPGRERIFADVVSHGAEGAMIRGGWLRGTGSGAGQTHEISHSRRRSSEGQGTHRNG